MNRRGFLQAMLAAGAAPAIIKASSLMPLWVPPKRGFIYQVTAAYESLEIQAVGGGLLTPALITREALRILGEQLEEFGPTTERDVLRIMNDWHTERIVTVGDRLIIRKPEKFKL